MPESKNIMIVAGEASGDQHGACLVRELKKKSPGVSFVGIGGSALKAEGVDCIIDSKTLSVVGITEVFLNFFSLLKGIRTARAYLNREKPDLLILIDFPDFNLHLAKLAQKNGIPVLYYISPQIWAWRKKRIEKIKQRVTHMAVIFPFEVEVYRKHGVPVTFVGHPLAEDMPSQPKLPVNNTKSEVITLLPGSRHREIEMLLPVMLDAARMISGRGNSSVRFLISCAPSVEKRHIVEIVGIRGRGLDIEVSEEPIGRIFLKSSVAIAASGTVTLQAAIYGVPHVIIYKVSPLSYTLARWLVKIKHIGLVNLIYGERIVPELIQDAANADDIAKEILHLLDDESYRLDMKRKLMAVQGMLGESGASKKVASIALSMIEK